MQNRQIIAIGLIAGLAAAHAAHANVQEFPAVRHGAPAPACPRDAYVTYPEASHIAYPQGVCSFAPATAAQQPRQTAHDAASPLARPQAAR